MPLHEAAPSVRKISSGSVWPLVRGRYNVTMIDIAQVAAYLRLKAAVTAAVHAPDSGFEPSRREMSEGLARAMPIAGESWTYSTRKGGYSFTAPRRRFSVFIAEVPTHAAVFTASELLAYLRAFTALDDLNEIVVDMWLTRAAMRGEVEEAPGLRGCWRLPAGYL